jgi:predicted ATPase
VSDADVPQLGFSSISVGKWRQFEQVDIQMHSRLTVITGANASGKSTLLGILGRHFSWMRAYSSAPFRMRDSQGVWYTVEPDPDAADGTANTNLVGVGEVRYGTGGRTEINVPAGPPNERTQYDIQLPQQESFPGVYLPSHRAVSGNYAQVTTIPTTFGNSDELFESFTNELRARWTGGWTGKSPQLALKESLIAAAVFGGTGNEFVDPNPEAQAIWTGFQEVLAAVLPQSLGFRKMRVRVPDILIESNTGDFVLDEASGGMSALVEVAWQIFLRSRNQARFTVILDEPENHLHPSLQRRVMPSLMEAFPSVQFVVATHSPLVVTSTPDSTIFVLDYNEDRKVVSRHLDYARKAAGADETLRRVLGLESTFPDWAESRFNAIVARHLHGSLSSASLQELRSELRSNGLEPEYAKAVALLAQESDEQGNL